MSDVGCWVIVQKKLAALQTLELYNCDVTQTDEYRDKIFELLDSVLYVDGFDRDGEPAPDEDEVDDYDGEGTDTDIHALLCLNSLLYWCYCHRTWPSVRLSISSLSSLY